MQNESITTGRKARKGKKERVSKMCLTAGACVGVMGDPAGAPPPDVIRRFVHYRFSVSQVCCSGDVTIVVFQHTHSQEHIKDVLEYKYTSIKLPLASFSPCPFTI